MKIVYILFLVFTHEPATQVPGFYYTKEDCLETANKAEYAFRNNRVAVFATCVASYGLYPNEPE